MMEVTILKTIHSGHAAAKKLTPYIEECDIFSLEGAAETERGARGIERDWIKYLESGMSMSDFNKACDTALRLLAGSLEPGQLEYNKTVYGIVYRFKRGMYASERLDTDNERNELVELFYNGDRDFSSGLRLIREGRTDEGFEKCYNGARQELEMFHRRDKNIGENLGRAESIIRQNYPFLSKPKIKMTLQIGCAHYPEKYATIPVTVKDITKGHRDYERARLHNEVCSMISDGAPMDSISTLLLKISNDRQYK